MSMFLVLPRGFKPPVLKVPEHVGGMWVLAPSWPLLSPFLAETWPLGLRQLEQARASPENGFPVLHSASGSGWLS